MSWRIRTGLVGLAVALWAGVPASVGAEDLEGQGGRMYQQYCAACHGAEADGKGPVSSTLDPAPPDLRRIAERRKGVFPDAEILRIIDGRNAVAAHGSREMPVWGNRFDEGLPLLPGNEGQIRSQILAVMAYLKSIQIGMK